jgi:hypothetical protein
MTRTKELELWTKKLGKCVVTPQVMCPTAKSLLKRDEPKAPAALHSPLGITNHSKEKTNYIADCLEKQFTCVTRTMKDG